MDTHQYRKVDAFTSELSLGNPAACIYLDENQTLTDAQMLEIAKQHKGFVSEVVYCKSRDGSAFELTYYSSECEVNFCGHGTIGCMYTLIKNSPQLQKQQEIVAHTRKKGDLIIYNKIPEQNAVYISAPEAIHLDVPTADKDIAKNLQIDFSVISHVYPIDFIDAGNRILIVPITTLKDEISIFPDEQILKDFSLRNGIEVVLIFCMDAENKIHTAHTRVFAPKFGYLEDPATGSANAAFGYYMLKNNLWDGNKITLEQGGNDRVYNTVHLCVQQGKLLFGGSAITRIEGNYFL